MCLIYIATGMPKINRLILLEFHFYAYWSAQFSVQLCTVFCAKERIHVFSLKALQVFEKGYMCSGTDK